jgi:hypothetical protein
VTPATVSSKIVVLNNSPLRFRQSLFSIPIAPTSSLHYW